MGRSLSEELKGYSAGLANRLDRARRRARQTALIDQAAAGEVQVPADKQPEAIKLVMDQMEAMAPRYSAGASLQNAVE